MNSMVRLCWVKINLLKSSSGVHHTGVHHTGVHHTGVHHTGVPYTGVHHTGVQHTGVCLLSLPIPIFLSLFNIINQLGVLPNQPLFLREFPLLNGIRGKH